MKSRPYLPPPNVPAVDIEGQAQLIALHDDIATIRCRIARAEKDRDTWKMSGSKEKFLEAYFLVEALELQLGERLRKLRPAQSSNP